MLNLAWFACCKFVASLVVWLVLCVLICVDFCLYGMRCVLLSGVVLGCMVGWVCVVGRLVFCLDVVFACVGCFALALDLLFVLVVGLCWLLLIVLLCVVLSY